MMPGTKFSSICSRTQGSDRPISLSAHDRLLPLSVPATHRKTQAPLCASVHNNLGDLDAGRDFGQCMARP